MVELLYEVEHKEIYLVGDMPDYMEEGALRSLRSSFHVGLPSQP
jgi:hypothetical protein